MLKRTQTEEGSEDGDRRAAGVLSPHSGPVERGRTLGVHAERRARARRAAYHHQSKPTASALKLLGFFSTRGKMYHITNNHENVLVHVELVLQAFYLSPNLSKCLYKVGFTAIVMRFLRTLL